jgi:hypothetical protein
MSEERCSQKDCYIGKFTPMLLALKTGKSFQTQGLWAGFRNQKKQENKLSPRVSRRNLIPSLPIL